MSDIKKEIDSLINDISVWRKLYLNEVKSPTPVPEKEKWEDEFARRFGIKVANRAPQSEAEEVWVTWSKTNEKKISHVNPNCKDASKCNPHSEIGPVSEKE